MERRKRTLEKMGLNTHLENTYRRKKIFITGHSGFKGTWLTLWLERLGANVKGYSLKPESDSLFKQVAIKLKCKSIFADIRNYKRLEKEINDFQPDFIFHLAAQSLVRRSYKFPLYTFETNILGTAHLLQSLTTIKKSCVVVVVTTDKVYENKEKVQPYIEDNKLGGHDPYSSSKACSEIVTSSYIKSFFSSENFKSHKKSISTVRAGNVIGGGDYSEDRLIPDIIKSLKKNDIIKIRNPNSYRPWQYVLEPLFGYLLLAHLMSKNPKKYSSSYNFGPNNNDILNVESVVRLAINFWGKGNYKIDKNKKEPYEASILRLNTNKAMKLLGWKPLLDTREAIYRTINWYKNSLRKDLHAYDLCIKEISKFI